MPGAPSSLQSAGTGGRHPQNIKRDILRKLNRVDPGQGVSDPVFSDFVLFFPRRNCCYFDILRAIS